MNLSQLEYLVTSIECGSYANAAKKLFITPQAISKSMNELEKELGVNLLVKTGRNVRPTRLALDICSHADLILSAIEEIKFKAYEEASENSATGQLDIAICSSPYRGCILPTHGLSGFSAANPHVHLTMHHHTNESCFLAVKAGLVNAAVTLGDRESDFLSCRKIGTIFPLVAMHCKDGCTLPDNIKPADLAGREIAIPSDLSYAHAALSSTFDLHEVDVSFISIPPFYEEHIKFLKEGGVVFLLPHESAIANTSNIATIQTSRESGFSFSVNYVLKKSDDSVPDSLRRHLKHAIRSKH